MNQMSELIAKPIIENQYWVVTNGKDKVGNVVADNGGYEVKINGVTVHYNDISSIEKDVPINFVTIPTVTDTSNLRIQNTVNGKKTYNNLFDVKRKIHLYTKTPDSKCYYASGFYNIFLNEEWVTLDCPKYIYIQRYKYYGPFESMKQATDQLKNHG